MNAKCFHTGIMSEGPLNITNATEGPLGTMNATEGLVNMTTPITTPILCQGKLFLILDYFLLIFVFSYCRREKLYTSLYLRYTDHLIRFNSCAMATSEIPLADIPLFQL